MVDFFIKVCYSFVRSRSQNAHKKDDGYAFSHSRTQQKNPTLIRRSFYALLQKIQKIKIKNKNLGKKFGVAGKKFAESYGWEDIASKAIEKYNHLINR